MSTDKRIPGNGFFREPGVTAEMLRQMYGTAIKYILDENNWDDSWNVKLRKGIHGESFENHEYILSMIEGFEESSSREMKLSRVPNNFLMEMTGAKYKSSKRSRIRKKRFSEVRNKFETLFRKKYPEFRKCTQGLTNFAYSVKDHYTK